MIKMRNTIMFALAFLLVLGVMLKLASAWHDGCTPGFWKNHPEAWPIDPSTGYQLDTDLDLVSNFFIVPGQLAGDSLLEALKYRGGRGNLGAARILLRTAVAAMLNILHPAVQYRGHDFGIQDFGDLKTMVDNALSSGAREEMLELAELLDGYNNWYCPFGD
jgi:hypothetical protein